VFHNLINAIFKLHAMMNMYEMQMLMIWDMNACLTPRGVTMRHVVGRGCDTPVESFVFHSSNIGHRSRARLRRKGEVSVLKLS
jgi:hypothetical protein